MSTYSKIRSYLWSVERINYKNGTANNPCSEVNGSEMCRKIFLIINLLFKFSSFTTYDFSEEQQIPTRKRQDKRGKSEKLNRTFQLQPLIHQIIHVSINLSTRAACTTVHLPLWWSQLSTLQRAVLSTTTPKALSSPFIGSFEMN